MSSVNKMQLCVLRNQDQVHSYTKPVLIQGERVYIENRRQCSEVGGNYASSRLETLKK